MIINDRQKNCEHNWEQSEGVIDNESQLQFTTILKCWKCGLNNDDYLWEQCKQKNEKSILENS